MKKRMYALFLAVCLITGSISETAFAKTTEEIILSDQQSPEEVQAPEASELEDKMQPEDAQNLKEKQETVSPEEENIPKEVVIQNQEVDSKEESGQYPLGGYIDVLLDLPAIETEEEGVPSCRSAVIPAKYDGRTQMPSARNQSPYNTCWAFSALAAGEASLIRAGADTSLDLSEYQLSYFFYNPVEDPLGNTAGDKTIGMIVGEDVKGEKYLNVGGNSVFTTWAMAGWKAGGDESKSRYESISATGGHLPDTLAYDNVAHLQNAYWLPFNTRDGYRQENQQRVKEMIMEYGAVGSSYNHNDSYYNFITNAYCSSLSGTNHAISIVGWDDNFSRSNFKSSYQPQGNGAWLVRNSWGSNWGESGYFWMSYEEKSLNDKAFVFLFEDADNYDYNYQYDGSSGIQTLDMYMRGISVANRFDVYGENAQVLRSVAIGIFSPNTNYSIQIYKDPQVGNPISGTPMLSTPQAGIIPYTGYHTIRLREPVKLDPGDSFSVVFTLPDGGSIFLDRTYPNSDWIRFVSNTEENQSFLVQNGGVVDLSTQNGGECVRIKAFTDVYQGVYSTQVTQKANATEKTNGRISHRLDGKEYDYDTIYAPTRVELSANTLNYTGKTVKPTVKAVYDSTGKKVDVSNYKISYENSSKNPGSYMLKVNFTGEYYTGSIVKTYKIAVGSISSLKNSSQSTSSIKVSWKQQKYATGYALYVSTAKNGTYKRIAAMKKNATCSYTYSKLKAGQNYYFKIRAFKTIGGKNYYSAWSSVSSATKPERVTGLKGAAQSSSQIKLSWKKVSGASSYEVYRYHQSEDKYERVAAVSGTSYLDKKLRAGVKYQYKVRACKNSGNIVLKGSGSSAATIATKPAKVTSVKASSIGRSSLKLSWKKVNGASGYEIYRYNRSTRKYERLAIIKSGSTLSWKEKSLKKNTKYQYKVRAYKKLEGVTLKGSCSDIISVKTKK